MTAIPFPIWRMVFVNLCILLIRGLNASAVNANFGLQCISNSCTNGVFFHAVIYFIDAYLCVVKYACAHFKV